MPQQSRFKLYSSLFKFRITVNVVLTTFIGFYIGETVFKRFIPEPKILFVTLMSTAMVCAGVCCLNHVIEWKDDLKMERTKNRPIPSGKISIAEAVILGNILVWVGLVWMYFSIKPAMAIGALATSVLYLFIYTPMKKISWWNTTIGAIPGALPILGGWYAARGYFGWEGIILFFMLFFWQHPHFYAIAWVCRKDYEQGGYKMITKDDETGSKTFLHSIIHTIILIVLSFTLIKTDFQAGMVYLIGMMILNVWFFVQIVLLYLHRNQQKAKRVIMASVIYLSTMFALFFFDQQFYFNIF